MAVCKGFSDFWDFISFWSVHSKGNFAIRLIDETQACMGFILFICCLLIFFAAILAYSLSFELSWLVISTQSLSSLSRRLFEVSSGSSGFSAPHFVRCGAVMQWLGSFTRDPWYRESGRVRAQVLGKQDWFSEQDSFQKRSFRRILLVFSQISFSRLQLQLLRRPGLHRRRDTRPILQQMWVYRLWLLPKCMEDHKSR